MFGFNFQQPVEQPEPDYEFKETELENVLKNINLVILIIIFLIFKKYILRMNFLK